MHTNYRISIIISILVLCVLSVVSCDDSTKPPQEAPPQPAPQDHFVISGTTLVSYTGTDALVRIPRGITRIGDRAFRHMGTVTGVELPDTVEHIGRQAFAWSGISEIIIPASVKTIEEMGVPKLFRTRTGSILGGIQADDVRRLRLGWLPIPRHGHAASEIGSASRTSVHGLYGVADDRVAGVLAYDRHGSVQGHGAGTADAAFESPENRTQSILLCEGAAVGDAFSDACRSVMENSGRCGKRNGQLCL